MLTEKECRIIDNMFAKKESLKWRNKVLYDLATNELTAVELNDLIRYFDITHEEIMEEKRLWIIE